MEKSLDYNGLSIKFKENDKLDFVADAISIWHVIGIDSFLYDLYIKNKKRPKGIILIESHADGFIINETDFICQNYADVEFYSLIIKKNLYSRTINFFKEFFLFYFHNENKENGKKPFYLISPLIPYLELIKAFFRSKLFNKYSPVVILVDEGIGTYLSGMGESKLYIKKSKYLGLNNIISSFFKLMNKILLNKLLQEIPIYERFIFNKSDKLEVNPNLVEFYRKIFELRHNSLDISFKLKKSSENAVLLITTNYLGEISIDDEINLIEELIVFLNEKNLKIILKPHPREDISKYQKIVNKYSIEVLKNDFPVEDLLSYNKPRFVIGFNSSSLLHAKIFFRIPSISLCGLLDPNFSANEFKGLTENIIIFVEDFEQLEDHITNILTK